MKDLKIKEDQGVVSGLDNVGAKAAIDLYMRAMNSRRNAGFDLDNKWQQLVDFYNESMNGDDTYGEDDSGFGNTFSDPFKVKSKLFFQSLSKLVKNMRRPSRSFKSSGVDKEKLEAIKDGVDMVQLDGGLYDTMTEDFNLFSRFTSLGDSFIMLGYGDDAQPVKFTMPQLTNTYIDPSANCFRNKTGIGSAGEALVKEEMRYTKAKGMYQGKRFMSGNLPLSTEFNDNFNQTEYQKWQQENSITEIGHYFNIDDPKNPYYCIIAGVQATVLKKAEGKDYPFYDLDGKPFIPLIHFKGLTSPTGFYNFGIWHLLFDFAKLEQAIRNMALKHVETNVNPVGIVNIDGTAEEFLLQWSEAREAQALGERGFIVNQINNGTSSNSGNMTELSNAPLTGEYERMLNDLSVQIKRCGIPIDESDRPSSQTATTTLAEESSKLEFIQDIMERNIESFRDCDSLTMAMMATGISIDNDKKVVTDVLQFQGQDTNITLAGVADAIKNSNIDVDVESRTGAYKSEAFRIAASNELMQLSVGTAVEGKVKAEALRLRGLPVTEEELTPQQQEPQPGQGEAPANPTGSGQAAQLQQIIAKSAPTV